MRAGRFAFRAYAVSLVLLGVALLGGATAVYFAQSPPARPHVEPQGVATTIEPDLAWRLTRLDGESALLGDFEETVLFVNNWATWCAPCIAEMPTIERLAERFEDRSVAFVVVSDEPADTVASFAAEHGWQVPIYTTDARPAAFQTEALPSTFILDGARRVAFSHMGIADWDDGTTEGLLNELLAESI